MDARTAAFLTAEMAQRLRDADASIGRVLRRRTSMLARQANWTDEVAGEMAGANKAPGWYCFDDVGSIVSGPYPSQQEAQQHPHDSIGQWDGRIVRQADYADYKADRPLTGEQARDIEEVLPGVSHVPFEKVPFWDALNQMQGTHAGMDPQTYADTREQWWEHNVPPQQVTLDPKRLVVTQKTVNAPRVRQLMEHPETGGDKPLYMVHHGGKDYTINGHHRIVADLLKGNLDHSVRLLDLDKAGQVAAAYDPHTDPRMHQPASPVGDLDFAYHDMLSRLHPDDAAVVRQHLHASLTVEAHDSGDGETIYHCPFCGSGQVIGGSDGTTSCDFCGNTFTVQIQPEFSAMPQTVDGTSYPMPGMPGAPTDTPTGADAEDDVDAAQEDAQQQGAPPAPGGAQPPQQAVQFPPQIQTATGSKVSFEEALAHYALRNAGDVKPLVLRKVRAMHEGN